MIGRTLEIKAYFRHRNIRSIMRFYSYCSCILFTCHWMLKLWGFPFSTCLENEAQDLPSFVSLLYILWCPGTHSHHEELRAYLNPWMNESMNIFKTEQTPEFPQLSWCGVLAVPAELCSSALAPCVEQPFLLLIFPSDSRDFTLCVWAHP